MRIPLTESASITLDVDGGGTVVLQPNVYGETWYVKRLATSASSNCKLRVYRDIVSDTAKVDSTYSGMNDISDCDIVLGNANKLVFVWTEGDAGGYATIRIDGEKETGLY